MASLLRANLTGAILVEADFSNARLQEANLTKADLTGAIITQDQLNSASSLECTIFPDGQIRHGENCESKQAGE